MFGDCRHVPHVVGVHQRHQLVHLVGMIVEHQMKVDRAGVMLHQVHQRARAPGGHVHAALADLLALLSAIGQALGVHAVRHIREQPAISADVVERFDCELHRVHRAAYGLSAPSLLQVAVWRVRDVELHAAFPMAIDGHVRRGPADTVVAEEKAVRVDVVQQVLVGHAGDRLWLIVLPGAAGELHPVRHAIHGLAAIRRQQTLARGHLIVCEHLAGDVS